jgi:hypothetical protein
MKHAQCDAAEYVSGRMPAMLLVALVVLLVGTPSCARPPVHHGLDPELMGMVIRDPWYDFGTSPGLPDKPNYAAQDRMGAMLAQMGVRWVRLEFHIEGSNALAQVARNDYFIREVAPRHNIKVLGLLSFGLVRGNHPRELGAFRPEHDTLYGPGIGNLKRTWLNRARMIANRYRGAIAAYEIFNEPNRITENGDEGMSANELARLHATFYRFFRHVDRAAPGHQSWRDNVHIILGGPQPAGTGQLDEAVYLSDLSYLRQVYASGSFVRYHMKYGRFPLDGLAYHPYPHEIHRSLMLLRTTWIDSEGEVTIAIEPNDMVEPEPQADPTRNVQFIQTRLNQMRDLLTELGDPLLPFWITEIGYNAALCEEGEANQAEFLRLVYTTLAQREDVERIFWFKYEDFPPAIGPGAQQWGPVVIPFVQNTACPGGACYDPAGRPVLLRSAFWAYRDLSEPGNHLPEPPAQVAIDGPLSGSTNDILTFTATLSRTTAAQPVAYVWHMEGAEGQDTVKNVGHLDDSLEWYWLQPGTYAITVEAANSGGTVTNRHIITITAAPEQPVAHPLQTHTAPEP